MDGFDNVLAEAAAGLAPGYFLLRVDGADPVYRERVYCYELYHQMRRLWPKKCDFVLNGEVDKQQHPYFVDHRYPKPDFLVHVPGTDENYVVIEVKARVAVPDDIRKDIATLIQFRVWYQRAVYLIYGIDPEEARERITAHAEEKAQLGAIELWVHPKPGTMAVRIPWAEQGRRDG